MIRLVLTFIVVPGCTSVCATYTHRYLVTYTRHQGVYRCCLHHAEKCRLQAVQEDPYSGQNVESFILVAHSECLLYSRP